MNINIAALVDALIPLIGGLVATVYAYKNKDLPDSNKIREGLKKKLLWLGPVMIVFGIFLLSQARPIGKLTPETVVAAIKQKTAFPIQVDEFTRIDSVEANRERITFVLTISKPISQQAEKEALISTLRSKIRPSVCANKQNLEVLDAGISVEYIYFVGHEVLPSIVFSKADCA